MSLSSGVTPPPSGARRMTLAMLAVRDRADQFQGLPPKSAKPLSYLAAFQEAEPYLALPPHAFKLVSWLVRQTMAHDWETGSRPIAWPSARTQEEFLGLSEARVKMLNRALFEAGIFVMRDHEQGKRYGRRGPDKRIIVAYGFDLSPLALRYQEFVRIAAEARTERRRMAAARARVTVARRGIRQAAEMMAAAGIALPPDWPQLAVDASELVAAARGARYSDDLSRAADRLEALQQQAEQAVRQASKPVNTDPQGLVSKPHSTSTNLDSNPLDTVIVAEGSSRAGRSVPPSQMPGSEARPRPIVGLKRPAQLLELAPLLEQYVTAAEPSWRDVLDAAGGPLRHDLGISVSLWAEACHALGREAAALALAIVSTKPPGYFTKGAGGYFGGMIRKAQKGELFLERSLWKLREQKWGPASRTRQ